MRGSPVHVGPVLAHLDRGRTMPIPAAWAARRPAPLRLRRAGFAALAARRRVAHVPPAPRPENRGRLGWAFRHPGIERAGRGPDTARRRDAPGCAPRRPMRSETDGY